MTAKTENYPGTAVEILTGDIVVAGFGEDADVGVVTYDPDEGTTGIVTWDVGGVSPVAAVEWASARIFGSGGRDVAEGELAKRLIEQPVVIETVPRSIRESHEAAGNRGVYPYNGSERYIVPLAGAYDLVDDDGWTRVVRPATREDLYEYDGY